MAGRIAELFLQAAAAANPATTKDFSTGLSGLHNVLGPWALVSDWQCSVSDVVWITYIKLFTNTTIQ